MEIHTLIDVQFIQFCITGNLEGAKAYLRSYPNINISYNNEELFRYVCKKGYLDLAKWLQQVKPDINISAENDGTFRSACYKRHLELAKWLQSLKPYLYVIIYDDNGNYDGYKIRSKEEANLEKRKYALHLALQEETNILYHLPVDIVKAVTLFV